MKVGEDDSDVLDEKNLISSLSPQQIAQDSENLVVLKHLRKEYPFSNNIIRIKLCRNYLTKRTYEMKLPKLNWWDRTKVEKKCVVEDMCLRIPKGEIFGIYFKIHIILFTCK